MASVGVLLRRMCAGAGREDVVAARPVRVKRSKVVKENELERVLALAERDRPGAAGVVMLLDADDDCAATLGRQLLDRAEAATHLPVRVVLAVKELEAWLLAIAPLFVRDGLLDEGAAAPADHDGIRDAKGRLSELAGPGRSYVEVSDQVRFLARADLSAMRVADDSFDKFSRDVEWVLSQIPTVR